MATNLEKEKLIQGLSQDVAEAQAKVNQSSEGRGRINPVQENKAFAPKAIRIKGRLIADKELSELSKAFDTAVDRMVDTSSYATEQEYVGAKMDLRKKFDMFQLDAIRRGAKFEMEMKKRASDAAQQEAMEGMFIDTIATAAGAVVGGPVGAAGARTAAQTARKGSK
jgi:hypothetical protein